MTQTLPGADVRGYYTALGILLPGWAKTEASVRCFANPDTHRRGDRDPSCSVNLEHGAWHCHGCGAKGGAFDAATKTGHSERAAIDLMIHYGITERRHHWSRGKRSKPNRETPRRGGAQPPRALDVVEADVQHWRSELHIDNALIAELTRTRGWGRQTMRELDLGVDHSRITIPVRDHARRLIGLLRYQPWAHDGKGKMRAAPGSRRMLLPHPTVETARHVLLVEGEPDMIAARSRGLPAIALPGVDCWRPDWAPLFAGRRITVIMDADAQGRAVAERVAHDLHEYGATAIVDLAPDRDDGYDLTDWLLANPAPSSPACAQSFSWLRLLRAPKATKGELRDER
jgi:hypothetical protein